MKLQHLAATAFAAAFVWSSATVGDDIPPQYMWTAERPGTALAGHWQRTVVDSDGDVGRYSSLAVQTAGDHSGEPAISYYDATLGDLKYAWFDGSEWQTEVVMHTDWPDHEVGLFTSLDFAPTGHGWEGIPAISYIEPENGLGEMVLVVVMRWSGSWEALNWYNFPRPEYYTHSTSLKYGWCCPPMDPIVTFRGQKYVSGVGWKPGLLCLDGYGYATFVEQGDKYYGHRSSLAIFPLDHPDVALQGQPAVAYTRKFDAVLQYAWSDDCGETWETHPYHPAWGEDLGWFSSLVIFPSDHPQPALRGQPAVAYHDPSTGSLMFAWYVDNQWHNVVVDTGNVGTYPSLAILPNGQPAITYTKYDPDDLVETEWDRWYAPDGLKYAWHTGDDFEQGWLIETVDTPGDVGLQSSLAILPNGQPAVSYYDQTNGRLKYAVRVNEYDNHH
jgi:hypothetical protein